MARGALGKHFKMTQHSFNVCEAALPMQPLGKRDLGGIALMTELDSGLLN